MNHYLAFDIGGTQIKYAIIGQTGHILFEKKIPTCAHEGGNSILERVTSIAKEYSEKFHLLGIGVSSAGVIDEVEGKVLYASDNIPNYTGCEIKKTLELATHIKTYVENDVNAFALGELLYGEGKQYENLCCITLGTGIGGGLILNRRLYRGNRKRAGEIGYILSQGKEDYYEKRASTQALSQTLASQGFDMDIKQFFEEVRSGDLLLTSIFHEWCEEIAQGILELSYILDPDCIIIGGGVSAQGEFLQISIETALKKLSNGHFIPKISISKLSGKANLLGAIAPFLLK